MYSTCLFCSSALGANQEIEHFPVGRRLAFDGAKGRLWVVCRRCERWNLTPLEERWEAIEECERAFGATRLRVSTDEIGLARLREGLELVRIGAPQRPEMAAWRYGDQFGRRKRRHYYLLAGGAVAAGAAIVAGPVMGLVGMGAVSPLINLAGFSRSIYSQRKAIVVSGPSGAVRRLPLFGLAQAKLGIERREVVLRVTARRMKKLPYWQFDRGVEEVVLHGADALRALAAILPTVNSGGGTDQQVRTAVRQIEETPDASVLLRNAAMTFAKRDGSVSSFLTSSRGLGVLPAADRLALEMITHEESERRALDGELYLLEAAWRSAEEIAGIADDLLLPTSVDDELARLKARDANAP